MKKSLTKLKIAIVSATLPRKNLKPGGVDVVVDRLASALAKDNDVTVLSLTPAPVNAIYKNKVFFIKFKLIHKSTILRTLLWPILLNFISFETYDVIHFHGDDWFFIRRTKPTTRTFHGSAKFEAKFAARWRRKISQSLFFLLEKISASLATIPVAINEQTAKIYQIKEIIGHGVDHNLFKPGKKTAFPSILFVGTWLGRKRGKLIFDLFCQKILPVLPKAKLYMVSDFCPKNENVIWVKNPDDKKLANFYRQSWIFCYPSLYEGFGLCYLEAMASATAVLASPNFSSRKLLDKESIVSDTKLEKSIIDIMTNTDKREKMVQKGLKIAKKFSWAKIALQYKNIYNKAIKKFES